MWREYREKENITDEDEKELRRSLIEKIPERKKIDVVTPNVKHGPFTPEQ